MLGIFFYRRYLTKDTRTFGCEFWARFLGFREFIPYVRKGEEDRNYPR
jgi:hypothetical protein